MTRLRISPVALFCCPALLRGPNQEADEDGNKKLDMGEFIEKLGPLIGENMSSKEIGQLFMKIDADCNGDVDW
jgi:Ca2+-binding EF-hand superfamily protein